jgi:uncharacterized membrane protein YgdD (TMEM256/DUF423 family)
MVLSFLRWRDGNDVHCRRNGGRHRHLAPLCATPIPQRFLVRTVTARLALFLASSSLFAAVAFGAFGAHALKPTLPADMMAVYQTAVQYHFWHALGLLGIGMLLALRPNSRLLAVAGWLLVAGMLLFSGSLYALAVTGVRGFGAITPLGGVAFLAAWACAAWAAWRW